MKEVVMRSPGAAIAAVLLIGTPGTTVRAQQDPCDTIVIGHVVPGDGPDGARVVIAPEPTPRECLERRPVARPADRLPLAVRPEMLAYHIDSFAGKAISVPYARVVGVLLPGVFLVDSQKELPPLAGRRARVLVFSRGRTLRVSPTELVGATVTISGVARTLLGIAAEGRWPPALIPDTVKHLEIKAAILADSVKTPDGIELTDGR